MKRGGVWVGTSGWVYKEWAGHFYPKGWPKKNEFAYYVQHFPTVEINATFYRLPTLSMVRGWRERSPQGFVFAVKGSRYLTHIRRLRDTSAGLQKYFRRLKPLGDRSGPILWQLPPTFAKNDETFARLGRFLAKLPTTYRHAVEFRHPSWLDEQTFAVLRRHNVANVWISSLRMPADYTLTADFVYLRFHGLKGGAYHDYTDAELDSWAKQLTHAARKGLPAYVYFNNDLNTRAPLNGHALMKLLGKLTVPPKSVATAPIGEIAAPEKKPETWRPWKRGENGPRSSPGAAEREITLNAQRLEPRRPRRVGPAAARPPRLQSQKPRHVRRKNAPRQLSSSSPAGRRKNPVLPSASVHRRAM